MKLRLYKHYINEDRFLEVSSSNQDYSTEEGAVKDEFYIKNIEHGDEEYDPRPDYDVSEPVDMNPNQLPPHKLRDSTEAISQTEGFYNEGEDTGPSIEGESDTSRKLSSLVAASHREERRPEDKQKSAMKASELHENITGHPLEINDQGEVVTETL
ncbi:637_t:CDS:2 [Funneliformis geosporum]|uniref:2625_t:CDS:1 n=1 Tax=Funneliformis geosporum TaxID=1117311 RepID=A0A9W4T1Y9_9GLOM|nr:2625_t:CDS:2 [Funneliformis geosporum]CAI2189437.1 637_t:CDS:2 [Funneliformis geosporum]